MTNIPIKIIVLAGYGLNCEEETALAFNIAGGQAEIVHINDFIDRPNLINKYQILAIPGGFSYGDDLGSGKAYANKLNNHLKSRLNEFASKDKLIMGICNGFQILTNLGLLPGVLTFNDNNRYTCRWVDVVSRVALDTKSPWLRGVKSLSLPIAHGEGKFTADDETLKSIQSKKMIGAVYYTGEMCEYQNLKSNPNGSLLDIAMMTSADGKILGTMPHPERAMFFTQLPNWPLIKEQLIRAGKPLPKYGQGLRIFRNAVEYFK
ncbi:MAG: phosphoribosylformylglycinamidine synthase I [Candidatus Doudnabacteria bacterium]|nr:phosphoribosylformylglycinamidine synthase I [Candidatus Doudnabacteria bacterium]